MTKARTLADNFAADINAVSAGTGITGGGTSGTVTVTNSMATAIDAKGDLVVGTGADTFSRLAVASTAGYLLSVDSAETTGLKWAAPAGGKVLQVVTATTTTETTVTSLTMTDTGLSGTITPSSASSKVLVLVSQPIWIDRITSLAGMNLRLMRDSTRIYGSADTGQNGADSGYSQAGGSTRIQMRWNYTITYLDSPATTSAITYKTQFNVQETPDSGSVKAQGSSQVGSIILLEIGA